MNKKDNNYSNKIIFTADIHLCQEKYEYIKEPLEFLLNRVKNEKPLITVLGGDIFHKRINSDDKIFIEGINKIIEISKHTKHLIVIEGTYSHDYNSLNILNIFNKYTSNIKLIKSMELLNLEELKILCLPEEYPEDAEEYYKDIFEEKYDYIFGHGDIEGGVYHLGVDNRMLKGFRFGKSELSKNSKYTIFGHLHMHHFIEENVLYSGSLARWKYGEEEDKGFIELSNIYEDKPTFEFIVTPTIKFDTIVIEDIEDIEKIETLKNEYGEGDNLKFKISKTNWDEKEEILESLNKMSNISKDIQNVKFESIKEENVENELEFKDLEISNIEEQYLKMLNKDIEDKKITKKIQEQIKDINIGNLIKELKTPIEVN
jgi:hypothetical protein